MSFDLQFYHSTDNHVSRTEIADYLSRAIPQADNQSLNEWLYQNEETAAYFSFAWNEPDEDEDESMAFDGMVDTGFSFNLNYLRPDFFGLEAFAFVKRLIEDLKLYVHDPQFGSASEVPYRPDFNQLYDGWSKFNFRISGEQFDEMGASYYPFDKSNMVWKYNYHRSEMQDRLGEGYFVPKLFFLKLKSENSVITVASWSEHIPSVIPPADYFLLQKNYKKWFRSIKESGLVSYRDLISGCRHYFEEFDFEDCKIIHPRNAQLAGKTFNSLSLNTNLESFAERIEMEKLYNNRK